MRKTSKTSPAGAASCSLPLQESCLLRQLYCQFTEDSPRLQRLWLSTQVIVMSCWFSGKMLMWILCSRANRNVALTDGKSPASPKAERLGHLRVRSSGPFYVSSAPVLTGQHHIVLRPWVSNSSKPTRDPLQQNWGLDWVGKKRRSFWFCRQSSFFSKAFIEGQKNPKWVLGKFAKWEMWWEGEAW